MKNIFISITILFIALCLSGCGAGSSAEPSGSDVGAGAGMATLSWTPPAENTDGSPLNDLLGYRIYYGYASDEVVNLLLDSDDVGANLSEYTIEGLVTGTTYYFGMTAVNNDGVESAMSSVVSKEL